MSDEARTPNAKTVRSVFVRAHPFSASTSYEDRRDEFDRFINKVKADALREAAAELRGMEDEGPYVTLSEQVKDGWGIDCGEIDQGYADWLRIRADRTEAGEA